METIEALNIALDSDLTKAAKILVNKSAEFIDSCDKLTKKQKAVFDEENPEWAKFFADRG